MDEPKPKDVNPPLAELVAVTSVGASYAAEGSWLLEAFIARNPAAEPELVLQLNRLLHRVFEQRWTGKKLKYLEVRGDCFELLARWRDEGTLTVEPLPFLAQRLMKQCARQQLRDRYQDTKLVSLDVAFGAAPEDKKSRRKARKLERQISALDSWRTPEQSLLDKELFEWLTAVREKLSPLEQATYDASIRLADGEVKSLHEALGIKEDAAWQRRKRMRAAIAEMAYKDGMSQIIDRWKAGRTPRRDKKVIE